MYESDLIISDTGGRIFCLQMHFVCQTQILLIGEILDVLKVKVGIHQLVSR